MISFDQQTVFLTGHMQFHTIAATDLEGNIVAGTDMMVMHITGSVMPGYIGTFGNHCCGNRQLR